MRIFNTCVG